MHRSSTVRLVLLLVLLSGAERAYGQPPQTQPERQWTPQDLRRSVAMFVVADIESRSRPRLFIESDSGTLVEIRNGVAGQPRTVVNTGPAREDLTFIFRSTAIEFGPAIEMHGFLLDSIKVQAAMRVGTLDLSYDDPNRAETTYESPTGVTGFKARMSAASYFHTVTDSHSIRFGADAEYGRDHGDTATRTPAQTGPVTSEHNEIHDQYATTSGELAFSWKTSEATAMTISAGAGYLWSDTQLDRQLVLAGPPGATTEATLRTALSKDGVFGTVGAEFYTGKKFSISIEGAYGAQSGISIGGTWVFP